MFLVSGRKMGGDSEVEVRSRIWGVVEAVRRVGVESVVRLE